MIAARVKVVHQKLLEGLRDLCKVSKRICEICEEYKEEVYLLGFRLVIAASDDVSDKIFDIPEEERNGVLCKSIFGSNEDVKALLKSVEETIDHKL